ncbi:MAG: hypothetical protein D6814_11970, partial [Calditrichaeota bacterium]
LSLCSAALVLLIKIVSFERPVLTGTFFLALAGLFLSDRLPVLAVLPVFSGSVFNSLLAGVWWVLLTIAAATVLLVWLTARVLRGKLYVTE